NHASCAFALEHRKRQSADRENLIGPKQRVDLAGFMIDIDYITKVASFVPKTRHKRIRRFREQTVPSIGKSTGDFERIEPQRLDLDRLADPRRHYPVTDLRIHPGQLHSRPARRDQTVAVGVNVEAGAARIAGEDRLDRVTERLAILRGNLAPDRRRA